MDRFATVRQQAPELLRDATHADLLGRLEEAHRKNEWEGELRTLDDFAEALGAEIEFEDSTVVPRDCVDAATLTLQAIRAAAAAGARPGLG
jgi:hypothetical protein